MAQTCADCLFAREHDADQDGVEFVECHRYAPKPHRNEDKVENFVWWPRVIAIDWCGEWQPSPYLDEIEASQAAEALKAKKDADDAAA